MLHIKPHIMLLNYVLTLEISVWKIKGLVGITAEKKYSFKMICSRRNQNTNPDRWTTKHASHPPFSQGAERRAEAQRRSCRRAVASRQPGHRRLLLWGLGFAGRAGAGFDVEVLQDVVVDLGGDLLLLQHLLDGLVGGAGSDRGTPLRRTFRLERRFKVHSL